MRRISVLLLAVLVATGCGGGKSTYVVKQFLPEYEPPSVTGRPRVDEAIRIEPFSTAQAFAGTAMVYRPSPFELNAYSRERWRVAPGDMVTDFLLRDLRASGAFKAVLAWEDRGKAGTSWPGPWPNSWRRTGTGGPRRGWRPMSRCSTRPGGRSRSALSSRTPTPSRRP
ncbi:MAG: membrane integrity-associated transporter subunit PqiC [Syntrophaceae bacterium]|nr:membrane integrity-associated transporter subunit PqiC [Syntrophaceae bacterium]